MMMVVVVITAVVVILDTGMKDQKGTVSLPSAVGMYRIVNFTIRPEPNSTG